MHIFSVSIFYEDGWTFWMRLGISLARIHRLKDFTLPVNFYNVWNRSCDLLLLQNLTWSC